MEMSGGGSVQNHGRVRAEQRQKHKYIIGYGVDRIQVCPCVRVHDKNK